MGVDDPTTKHSGMSTSVREMSEASMPPGRTIPVMTMSLKNVTARSMRWRNSSASFSKVCNMLTWRHTATTPLAAIKSIPYTTFARPNRVHSMIPVTSFPVWISSRGQEWPQREWRKETIRRYLRRAVTSWTFRNVTGSDVGLSARR